jgi:hypothetical protein
MACLGEWTGVYRVLVWTPDGKRPLGSPRRRWENSIKMALQEVGWGAWTEVTGLRTGPDGGLF